METTIIAAIIGAAGSVLAAIITVVVARHKQLPPSHVPFTLPDKPPVQPPIRTPNDPSRPSPLLTTERIDYPKTKKPKAPVNLTATAGDGKVSLSWMSSGEAISFRIYRRPASDMEGEWRCIHREWTTSSFVDTEVTNGNLYCYVVRVWNGNGESDPSNEVSGTPHGGHTGGESKTSEAPELFENKETEYMDWLKRFPAGYVVNARKSRKKDLFFLHKANCHHISRPKGNQGENPFTCQDYIKVCSQSIERLLEWGRKNLGIEDFTNPKGNGRCTHCNP